MEAYVMSLVLEAVVDWVLLMIAVPIAQRLTDGSRPPFGEVCWKLGVVTAGLTAVAAATQSMLVAGWVIQWVGLWILMAKWFDMDVRGVVVVVLCKAGLTLLASFALGSLLR